MASKKHKKKILAQKKQQQKSYRPSARLQEAQQAFRDGDFTQATALAELALGAANDQTTQSTATELLAEIHLHQAAAGATPGARLHHLDKALEQTPDQARLHYQRALMCWRMGDLKKAIAEFEFVAKQDPQRPGLLFLRQLGHVASGQPWSAAQLSAAESNTLHFLQRVQQGEAADRLLADLDSHPQVGKTPEVWPLLLGMLDNPKSAPITGLQDLVQTSSAGAPNPVLNYYLGVAAMRKGDVPSAQVAWQEAAKMLAMPWLIENLLHLRRDVAGELAQAGQWPEVVTLYEATVQELPIEEIDPVLVETAAIAYYHLGYAAAQENKWPQALKHWRAADQLVKSRNLSQNLALAEEALENWVQAAEAWREMVRRRPRKADHPDYLSDAQVATIWQRAADCYDKTDEDEEVVTCLRTAVKYAPDDLALRIRLVDALLYTEHRDAAENELDRILESAPKHVPALMRLGVLYTNRWERNPMPIWQRVLAEEPNNADAQQALAAIYLHMATDEFELLHHTGQSERLTPKRAISVLETGLKELPDHPLLLIGLAKQYQEQKKNKQARDYYGQALRAAPQNVRIADIVLHDLLHVDGGDIVRELTPQVRQVSGLRPNFWVEQGEKALACDLGNEWAEFFWDQATATAANMQGADSPAATLLKIFDAAQDDQQPELARKYEQRLRADHAKSGAVEYIEAAYALQADPDRTSLVLGLLRKAKANATKAREVGIVEIVEELEQILKNPPLMDGALGDLFRDMLENFDEGDLDAFRRRF